MTDTVCYQPLKQVIHQTLDDEAVIINLENGRYYSLNATASFIWNGLVEQYTVPELAETFARQNHIERSALDAALTHFVNELLSQELITPTNATARPLKHEFTAVVKFETPQMEIFTDMEQLIPLDPIHQVGAMGWPFQDTENP